MAEYIGNDDFRGYLQYLANAGDSNATMALNYTGNDGGVNNPVLVEYTAGPGTLAEDQASQQSARDYVSNAYNTWQNRGSTTGGTGTTVDPQIAIDAKTKADNNLYFDAQDSQLNSLLGRTQTNLDQGLTQNQDQYNTEVGGAGTDKENAYKGYAGNRQDQFSGREKSRSTNNINAGTGYRSLAQIIGRASGSGSSAYRDLLPNVVGNDLASKQLNVDETYGQNLRNIDKRQNEYDSEYSKILTDLLTQRNNNESTLRTNIEGQRQNIYGQQAQVAGQRATNNGGRYAQVAAAQAPSNANIENSRNTVEGFFNQFRTPYTRQAAVAGTPDLSTYTTDSTNITAQNTGNQNNPYASLLRRKLQQ